MKAQKRNVVKTTQSIYALIAEKFGAEIPIMKDLPRDEKSVHINFPVMSRVKLMADKMANKLDMFDVQADIHRAAHYFGLFVLYHILVENKGSYKYKSIYDNLMAVEKINSTYQVINDLTYTMKRLYKSHRSGIIGVKEMNMQMDEIIAGLPENLQELAETKKEMILSGASLNELAEMRGRGIKNLRQVK